MIQHQKDSHDMTKPDFRPLTVNLIDIDSYPDVPPVLLNALNFKLLEVRNCYQKTLDS